jgi:hypothetical protein
MDRVDIQVGGKAAQRGEEVVRPLIDRVLQDDVAKGGGLLDRVGIERAVHSGPGEGTADCGQESERSEDARQLHTLTLLNASPLTNAEVAAPSTRPGQTTMNRPEHPAQSGPSRERRLVLLTIGLSPSSGEQRQNEAASPYRPRSPVPMGRKEDVCVPYSGARPSRSSSPASPSRCSRMEKK